jgi:alginate O-acetyltransferase complex protein AlgI
MTLAAIEPAKPILFVEFRFLWIFALIFGVNWMLRSNTSRKVWLLVCSHVFYGCFFIGNPLEFFPNLFAGKWSELPTGWWFPSLLWFSTIMDYFVGVGIEDAKDDRRRKLWVAGSLLVNLGVLCFFKYYSFFDQNVRAVFEWLHLTPSWEPLKVFLPYGISFYTFQSLSYSLEVYRKKLPAERSFLNLAFFVAFFPQVVAGPIVRAMTFLPQTLKKVEWSSIDVRGALALFLIGFVKKACVGDTLSQVSDLYFAAPENYSAYSAWAASLCYAGQIYCDFSGYSDMAIAVSRLLGYELCQNFAFPYFSASITEFWRRWHMSLSSWLRDYLYISLGGNRGSKLFTYRNLMLTMVLGGLWHGASWTFVVWGAMHGIALIFHREWSRATAGSAGIASVMKYVAVPLTFFWVLLTWIPFRANDIYTDKPNASDKGAKLLIRTSSGFQDLKEHELVYPFAKNVEKEGAAPESVRLLALDPKTGAWKGKSADGKDASIRLHQTGFELTAKVWQSLVLFKDHAKRNVCGNGIWVLLGGLVFVHWLNSRSYLAKWWRAIPEWLFSLLLGAGWAMALAMKVVAYKQFIYFQF